MDATVTPDTPKIDSRAAAAALWPLLIAARRVAAGGGPEGRFLAVDAAGRVTEEGLGPAALAAIEFGDGGWQILDCVGDESLLDLYLPICSAGPARPLLVAHLGQSLDGHIATASGDSNFVTGAGNLDHLHRMRALCDAILVGAGTVAADDPKLTTRRVPGPSPVRVVVDPDRRLPGSHGIFRDGGVRTIVVHADSAAGPSGSPVETIAVGRGDAGLDLASMLAALRERGLASIFVEGGGRTVSALLAQGLVDRLQVAVAPVVTGTGRRGLDLPPRQTMAECLRPSSRLFAMGGDVLFDCDLRAGAAAPTADTLPRRIG